MSLLLALAVLIPLVVLIVEARPDWLDRWWCEHIHQNRDHTRTDHHGVH